MGQDDYDAAARLLECHGSQHVLRRVMQRWAEAGAETWRKLEADRAAVVHQVAPVYGLPRAIPSDKWESGLAGV